jgi:ribonuclease D
MNDSEVQERIRAYATNRAYGAATTERWLGLEARDGDALLQLATELRLGENQLRDLWEWAEEIALRDGLALHQVLTAEPLAAVRRRHLGRNETLKAIKAALRRRRFPQLAATEERLAGLVRALQLPRTVRISLPEHLEGDHVRIEIVVDSAAAWQAAAASLLAAADTPACAELFARLGEAP